MSGSGSNEMANHAGMRMANGGMPEMRMDAGGMRGSGRGGMPMGRGGMGCGCACCR